LAVVFVLANVGFSDVAIAQKTVHVKGYTKKDSTYVRPHDRKPPETKSHGTTKETKETHSKPSSAVERDEHGRIQRSDAARRAFARQTGYPNGRPGYIIAHIKPLACGGTDVPSNMQWQTTEAAKAKDRVEQIGC
jgi:hypothetical protein